jgi:glucose-6-phosphate 1-epimerase
MDIIHVSNAFGAGRVSVQGAQLLDWQVKGQQPMLWCSDAKHWQPGEPIRGGIPLCFPWFGPAPTGKATAVPGPAHGFARRLNWRLVHHHDYQLGSELLFELTDNPTTRALWPHAFIARIRIQLGHCINVGFSYETVGVKGVNATAALHSYLHVKDIEQVGLLGLGPRYREAGQLQRNGQVTLLQGVTDRIYDAPTPYTTINDLGYNRTLSLWHRGHSDVVLWNPWQELTDAPEQQWRNFVCLETARIHRPLGAGGELAVEIVEV